MSIKDAAGVIWDVMTGAARKSEKSLAEIAHKLNRKETPSEAELQFYMSSDLNPVDKATKLRAAVDYLGEHTRMTAFALELEDLERKAVASQKAAQDYVADALRKQAEQHLHAIGLQRVAADFDGKRAHAEKCKRRKLVMEFERPDLFPSSRPQNLNLYTLRNISGDTIGLRDAKALELYVDQGTFQQESERRFAFYKKANDKAGAEHATAMEVWREKNKYKPFAEWSAAPERRELTWTDLPESKEN